MYALETHLVLCNNLGFVLPKKLHPYEEHPQILQK